MATSALDGAEAAAVLRDLFSNALALLVDGIAARAAGSAQFTAEVTR